MNYSGECGPRYTDKCCGCMLLAAGEIRHTADNTGLLKLKKKKKKRSQRAISQTIMVYAPADVV